MSDDRRTMSVCALVPYPPNTTPSQRFRIEQWRPYLKTDGIAVDLIPFADDRLMHLLHAPGRRTAKALAVARAVLRRCLQAAATARYDAVLIHRAACLVGPAMIERAIAWLQRPVIFDFDDAIYLLHTTEANRRFGWLKFPGKTAAICRLSAHVVVGNSYLADYARQFNPRVTVIPTSLDTDGYRPQAKNGSRGRVIVGWTGSATSQTHLELFAPVLRQLRERHEVELRVISNRRPELPGLPVVWRPWRPETEVEELRRFDIGIMPMPDDEWARGKCALKALQYMALGIPTIGAAVGANREVIQSGANGLLASTPEEWLKHLESLIDDPALRERLGAAGRRTIEAHYSMRQCAAAFARVVRDTVESKRSAISEQRSAVSDQRSAVSDQRSAVSDQRSAVSDQ
jgi:glycosyltransferase involved in cell wall biosynthesis